MHKTLVTYFSRTGNTKKVAEAIFASLDGDKNPKPIDEVPEPRRVRPGLHRISRPEPQRALSRPKNSSKRSRPRKKIALFSRTDRCPATACPGKRSNTPSSGVEGQGPGDVRLPGQAVDARPWTSSAKSPEHQEWTEMAASASTPSERRPTWPRPGSSPGSIRTISLPRRLLTS